jgi:hypothetical protein
MKKVVFNFRILSIIFGALLILSCKGDPGDDGAIGPQGPAGVDGVDGIDGVDGSDGNANVMASDWLDLTFPANWDGVNEARFEHVDANITQEVIDSYALLSYVRFSTATTAASSVPFVSLNSTYEIHDSMLLGKFVAFAIGNDLASQPNPPTNLSVRYVLIAPSSLAGKTDQPSLESMKKAGIDLNDYEAVMDHIGLDY